MSTRLSRYGFVGFAASVLCCGLVSGASLKATVSILPQAYLLDRIGGDAVDVEVLVPPGQSPATYTVSARQMARISTSVVFFRVGVPFENALLPKLRDMMPDLRIVDTRQGIVLRSMSHVHEHEHEHEHAPQDEPDGVKPGDHGGKDPHSWLDPRNAAVQAETMCNTLCRLAPDHADGFRRNLSALRAELTDLHERIEAQLRPVRGKTFMVFHPAFGYFADAYGLRQVPIETEGKSPSARQLARVIAQARGDDVQVIFVQPQFSRKAAEVIAKAINGTVVPIDALARDYVANLERMASAIAEGLNSRTGDAQ